jgi:hypothetical protein
VRNALKVKSERIENKEGNDAKSLFEYRTRLVLEVPSSAGRVLSFVMGR